MQDGPYYVVQRSAFTARFLIGGEPSETATNADVHVELPDGTVRYVTFFTLPAIERVLRRHWDTGETGGGAYFWSKDLVIVPEAGVPAMVRAVEELVRSGDIEAACQALPR
ncbi:hypothetical protein BDK92_6252 [Micromonospora pisi]|uniref:Uncharacterized protein n=1 Tax=Micromonospora pisi TaxID=589240 RepID=A0A495JS52_9ACTN|nr:hypothetical protein BDK92_6252 [Micromonospora pisi]